MAPRAIKKKGRSSPARNRSSETLEVGSPTRSRARRGPVERQYVAVDLHSRRSMIVRENEAADQRRVTRIDNDPMALAAALAERQALIPGGPSKRPPGGTGPRWDSRPRARPCT